MIPQVPANPATTQLILLTLHNSVETDAQRAIISQAMSCDLHCQTLSPVLNTLAQPFAAHRAKSAAPGAGAAVGPVLQILIADIQALVQGLVSNPAELQWLISLIEQLFHIPVIPLPTPPQAA